MLSNIKNKLILKSHTVVGVNCFIQPNGDKLMTYVVLTKKHNKVNIEQFDQITGNNETVIKKLPKDLPILLSIDGKGILHKKLNPDLSKSIIKQVIPNAVEEDFVYQVFPGTGPQVFISIARKNTVDEIIDAFSENKLPVIGFSVGPLQSAGLLRFFDQLPASFTVYPYQIECDPVSFSIIDYKRAEDSQSSEIAYTFGEQSLPSAYLLPFFNAFRYFIDDENATGYDKIRELQIEYNAKQAFKFLGWGMLLFALMVLLINLFIYMHFDEERKLLESQVSGTKEILAGLKQAREDFAWKEKFLNQSGILKNSRLSYLADQLASTVPLDITLQNMELHPLTSKIRKNKEIELAANKIQIDGITKNSLILNDWVQVLKKKGWIDGVNVINYEQDSGSAYGLFTIEITMF